MRPVCPCVPLCRAGGTVAGKSSLERICPDFGRREKAGAWSRYLQGRALTDAENTCRLNTGSEQPVKSLKSPQCGDFLQTLVKSRRHWFVAMKTTNAKIPLEKGDFAQVLVPAQCQSLRKENKMSEEYKKQRYSVWLSKDAVQKSDAAVVMEGLTNRSDFIEKAIHFYSGYLYQEKHMDFLSDVMMETVSGIMRTSENRLSKMLFKIAVEMAKLESMLAAINDMDEATMRRLHIRCVNEVKKINGILTMEEAVRYQRSDEE